MASLRPLARLLTTRTCPVQPPPLQPCPTSPLDYLVRRNSRGSIPVYTDIRNARSRYQVLVRNVHGNVHALADDLARTLFPPGSPEAGRIAIQIVQQKHLVITGGRWKNDVLRWLVHKGF